MSKLILIVGPSGVGKDSLIDGLRPLADELRLAFPMREITRPKIDDSEDFLPVEPERFDPANYAVSWQAHGLSYGIPLAIRDDLATGRNVILNGSRKALPEFEAAFANLLVVSVTARPEILAQRLAARGRETHDDIANRLKRIAPLETTKAQLVEIDNSGALETAQERLIALIRDLP